MVNDPSSAEGTRIHHDLEWREDFRLDIAQQMFNVIRLDRQGNYLSLLRGFRKHIFHHQGGDVIQAVIATDGSRATAHQLHAVVVDRVVAGSYHDVTAHLFMRGGEIDLFGTTEANVIDVDAASDEPPDQGACDDRTGESDVPTDDDPLQFFHHTASAPNPEGQIPRLTRPALCHGCHRL